MISNPTCSTSPGNHTGLRGKRPLENQVPFPYSEDRPWDIKRLAPGHLAYLEPCLPTHRPRLLPLLGDNHKGLGTGSRGANSLVFIPHQGSGCYQRAWHAPSKRWVSLLFQRRAICLSVSVGLHRSQAPKQVDTHLYFLPGSLSLYHIALVRKCSGPQRRYGSLKMIS